MCHLLHFTVTKMIKIANINIHLPRYTEARLHSGDLIGSNPLPMNGDVSVTLSRWHEIDDSVIAIDVPTSALRRILLQSGL